MSSNDINIQAAISDVVKLDSTNAHIWKEQVTFAFKKAKVWDMINGDTKRFLNTMVKNTDFMDTPAFAKGMSLEDGRRILRAARAHHEPRSVVQSQPARQALPSQPGESKTEGGTATAPAAAPATAPVSPPPTPRGDDDLQVDESVLRYWRYRLNKMTDGLDIHAYEAPMRLVVKPSEKQDIQRRESAARGILDATIGSYYRGLCRIHFGDSFEDATAHELWTYLLGQFKEISNARKAEVLFELLDNRMQKGEDPRKYAERVQILSEKAMLSDIWHLSLGDIYPYVIMRGIQSEIPALYEKLEFESSLDMPLVMEYLDRAPAKKKRPASGPAEANFGEDDPSAAPPTTPPVKPPPSKKPRITPRGRPTRSGDARCSWCQLRSHAAPECKIHPRAPKFDREFAQGWLRRNYKPGKVKDSIAKILKEEAGVDHGQFALDKEEDEDDEDFAFFAEAETKADSDEDMQEVKDERLYHTDEDELANLGEELPETSMTRLLFGSGCHGKP
eukprot:TRINITY_DN1082_c0_g2_i1.p1 TRINITY_DN1082_c0_g2~~TRINITY_DN1082_c0_g2_i1.p1  ORF type:complete len:504 (+),score=112.63 TRINITY_DN1082_c0_g2_i1:121-1632(+)